MQNNLHVHPQKCKNIYIQRFQSAKFFYHDRIKSAKIFTMTKLKVQKFYHYKIKSVKIFASKSLKTLLKNASSKFLKSLVRIRSHAVL